jgi:hypothetical protein
LPFFTYFLFQIKSDENFKNQTERKKKRKKRKENRDRYKKGILFFVSLSVYSGCSFFCVFRLSPQEPSFSSSDEKQKG